MTHAILLASTCLSLAAATCVLAQGGPASRPASNLPAGAESVTPPPSSPSKLAAGEVGRQSVETFAPEGRPELRLGYLLALPKSDDADRRYPLVIFLHGSGERGTDPRDVARHGPPRLIAEGRGGLLDNAIVVSPQCPPGQWWPFKVAALKAFLDHLTAEYRVDPDRVYVVGLSMGGFGAITWAASEPDRFAAVVSVCGGGLAEQARAIRTIPTWLYHGTADRVVPVGGSVQIYETMRDAGTTDVHLTLYERVGHDSWTPAFEEGRLWRWLFEQKRGG